MQLYRQVDAIRERGAELHLIGNGAPNFIEGFREETGYGGLLYTDPSRAAYDAAGLLRSRRATLSPRAMARGLQTRRAGFRQGKVQGDPWQQGGALIVDTQGQLLFSQRAEFAGDNVAGQSLLDAL